MQEIADCDLTLLDIPSVDAEWNVIGEFALTYNGYDASGSFEACAEIANAQLHGTLAELRACLFFEQRRWRHYGDDPDHQAMAYIRVVVEQIRARVAEVSGGQKLPIVWERARQLEGATLTTLHQDKPFTVIAVLNDCVQVLPQDGSGVVRSVRRDRIEHIIGLGLSRDELRQRVAQEYPDSRNTSYIAAIAFALCEHADSSRSGTG